MSAITVDCIDLNLGREGDRSRVGLAPATVQVGKAQCSFPYLRRCEGGVWDTGKELVNILWLSGFDMCGLRG